MPMLAATSSSPADALGQMLEAGETDPVKLIQGLEAKGYAISSPEESEEDREREGEPMAPDMDEAIMAAVSDSTKPKE